MLQAQLVSADQPNQSNISQLALHLLAHFCISFPFFARIVTLQLRLSESRLQVLHSLQVATLAKTFNSRLLQQIADLYKQCSPRQLIGTLLFTHTGYVHEQYKRSEEARKVAACEQALISTDMTFFSRLQDSLHIWC